MLGLKTCIQKKQQLHDRQAAFVNIERTRADKLGSSFTDEEEETDQERN